MRRLIASLVGAILLASTAVLPVAAASKAATVRVPKVVIVVGPVGDLTDEYRAYGDRAAVEARRWTSNVVKVYSPNATWPAVRAALQGASIVVYLGHGNGFPSPYRSSPWPVTQNGFGLNPVAGVDDDAHQYFGEASIAREVKLARHAVVLLSHLCYASGNPEPGKAEPTLAVAVARVDNYGAGWLAAGADAVIADSYGGTAPYIRELLTTNTAIRRIWNDHPGAHGNVRIYRSQRTPGYSVLLDTDTGAGGYHRSLVAKLGLRSSDVRSGAPRTAPVGTAAAAAPPENEPLPSEPTLVGSGIAVQPPTLTGTTVAGAKSLLRVGLEAGAGSHVPTGLQVGLRWDPIDVSTDTPGQAGQSGMTLPGSASTALGSTGLGSTGSATTGSGALRLRLRRLPPARRPQLRAPTPRRPPRRRIRLRVQGSHRRPEARRSQARTSRSWCRRPSARS